MVAEGAPTPGTPSRPRAPRGPGVGAAALAAALVGGLLVLGGPEREPPARLPQPPPTPGPAAPRSDPGAEAKLARADEATRSLDWQGTQFVARWSPGSESSAVVDVVHVPGHGSLVRPASTARAASALVPESAQRSPSPSAPLGLLRRHYTLRDAGSGRCAGRPADVVEAWRRDEPAGALAARFWLDRETGLVLRREVFDVAGRTVLASAFLDLTAGQEAPLGAAPPPAGGGRAGREQPGEERLQPVAAEALRAEGWPVPPRLAGLELHESRARGAGQDRLVHLAYSDGLLSVSVFAQAGELDPGALVGWQARRMGEAEVWTADAVPQRVAWSAEGTVYTVLADTPARSVDDAVTALPHEQPGVLRRAASEVRGRLARGLVAVARWVQPPGA